MSPAFVRPLDDFAHRLWLATVKLTVGLARMRALAWTRR